MGIGAMVAVMLRLPLTAVLLATVLLGSDGLRLTPLVIVAVVVAYVLSARLAPPQPSPEPSQEAQPTASEATPPAPAVPFPSPSRRQRG
jgi:H+/Cl- antiporter ClcA